MNTNHDDNNVDDNDDNCDDDYDDVILSWYFLLPLGLYQVSWSLRMTLSGNDNYIFLYK